MADLAFVFHWPPEQLWALDAEELQLWHEMAITRYKQANSTD